MEISNFKKEYYQTIEKSKDPERTIKKLKKKTKPKGN